nr:TetR/AcrR family transcriptional regulator [Mobilitalea sibirica]
MEEQKKINIINAGFKVFGENGYQKASVDQIVKEANISKGSLFYYFESKKNYYMYLYDYCAERMKLLIDDPGEDGLPAYIQKTDFFERLDAIQKLKMKYAITYPHITEFMKKVIIENSPSIKNEIQSYNLKLIKERFDHFFYKLDLHKFKEGVDPKMVMQLLIWCSEGCASQLYMKNRLDPSIERASPNFQEILDLYNSYVELLRKNFYKEEYL